MMSLGQARALLRGGLLLSSDRREIGPITQAFSDAGSTEVRWVTVRTGDRERFVPATAAVLDDLECSVPYRAELILSAPHPHAMGQTPTAAQEIALLRHFAQRPVVPPGEVTAPGLRPASPAGGGSRPGFDGAADPGAPMDSANGPRLAGSPTQAAGPESAFRVGTLLPVAAGEDAVARSG